VDWLKQLLHLAWTFLQRNSSGLSIFVTILGFGVTWWQLVRTQRAAAAALDASKAALAAVGRADTLSDVAAVQSGLHEIQVALRGKRYEAALIRSQHLREVMARVRTRDGFEGEARQLRVQKMVTDLRRLQDAMETVIASPDEAANFSAAKVHKALSNAAAELGGWIEELRFTTGGTP
jgi:hypothetical protein